MTKPAILATASLTAIYVGLWLIYEGQTFARIAVQMARDAK